MLMESLEWKGKEFPEIFISCKNGQSFQYVHNSILVVSKTVLSRGLVLVFLVHCYHRRKLKYLYLCYSI